MEGKIKCKILKGIRQRIADINGISYEPNPCKNTGDCMGTCEMCDEELAWLEMQLNAKSAEGQHVYITIQDFEDYESSLQRNINF